MTSLRDEVAAVIRRTSPDVDPLTALEAADTVILAVADRQREWAANLRTCPNGDGDPAQRLIDVKLGARLAANLVGHLSKSRRSVA